MDRVSSSEEEVSSVASEEETPPSSPPPEDSRCEYSDECLKWRVGGEEGGGRLEWSGMVS